MNILQRLAIAIPFIAFIACNRVNENKSVDTLGNEHAVYAKQEEESHYRKDSSNLLRVSSNPDDKEQTFNYIDRDVYVKEIKWAVILARDSNLMTLDSALAAFKGEWVSQDSIKKWWKQ